MGKAKKWQVSVTSDLCQSAVDMLHKSQQVEITTYRAVACEDELKAALKQADAVVCNLSERISAELLAACRQLKLVANLAVGYDNVDLPAADEMGVLVLNTPGVLDNATADLAFALLLACARRVVEADKFVRAGGWQGWENDLFLGTNVSGKSLGIIGMGRIGQAMARRAAGFDMNILYTGRNRQSVEVESKLNASYVSLDELLSRSDYVSLHCPLTEATRHLIGKRELALLKPNCILINTARGAVVDQAALVEALSKERLAGAGLDVFAAEPAVPSELMTMGNVVLTPHIGSATTETRQAMAELSVSGLLAAFSGSKPANVVNHRTWDVFKARL